jgi:hypothetical protein
VPFGDTISVQRKPLPPQDWDKLNLIAQRFQRDSEAQRKWAEVAKKAVNYTEGRQWSEADRAALLAAKRPVLTLNKIRPLVNIVLGYFLNNQTDLRYLPGHDGTGRDEVAAALTHIAKQIAESSQMPYVDTEVFLDGIITGRGYYDIRLDFRRNLLGEVFVRAVDPLRVFPDCDASSYDPRDWGRVTIERMLSAEEVDFFYGREALNRIAPFMSRGGVTGFPTSAGFESSDTVSPPTTFAQVEDNEQFYETYFADALDPTRKTVRLLDIQHYVLTKRWFFVDLETGDKRAIPDEWDRTRVEKALMWANEQGAPVVLRQLPTKRVRWTHVLGDQIVYDEWSPYDQFTIVPFFPYFRRGVTKGMVEDLTDAQDEVNKRRSTRLHILMRSSHGGWKVAKGSLDAQQRENLERFGSTPGVIVEYDTRNGTLPAPQEIQPGTSPVAFAQVEKDAEEDILRIAGINEAAMGQLDAANQSGRAIERRQRQAVIGQELTMANFRRSKLLLGRVQLHLIQNHYTEERIIVVTGGSQHMRNPIRMVVNQRVAEGIVNNLAVGSYETVVDETPLSKSFLEAQYDELMRMKEIGMPIPDGFIIDAASIARKEELKQALETVRQAQAQAAAAGMAPAPQPRGGGPGGSLRGADGGSLPAGGEPGAPVPQGQLA